MGSAVVNGGCFWTGSSLYWFSFAGFFEAQRVTVLVRVTSDVGAC